jgi:hypothetical protein
VLGALGYAPSNLLGVAAMAGRCLRYVAAIGHFGTQDSFPNDVGIAVQGVACAMHGARLGL